LDEVDQIFPRQESPELVYDQYCSLAQVLKSVLETPGRGGAISVVAAMEYQWIHLTDRFSNRQFQNPLYGRFRLKPVGLLQRDGWADMVQTLGELAGLEYVPEGLDLLYRKSSGHPDITRRLCSCLVELRDDGKISSPIVAEDVALALGHFLKHPHSYAYYLKNTFWNNPLSVDLDAEQRLVLELAKEQELSEESLLSRLLERYQEYARAQTGAPASNERIIEERSRLTDALCHLVELGIITEDKQKGTYAISIPIYRDWIRQEILAMEVEYQ